MLHVVLTLAQFSSTTCVLRTLDKLRSFVKKYLNNERLRSSLSFNRTEAVVEPPTIDHVKVIPPKMVFSDAFDGKMFTQSLTIINCGKYPAFVRVMPPSSKTFRMKAVPKGMYLPSGLSITRKIFYTHTSAMALPQACLFIYVNGKPINYQIEVYLIAPYVSLTPQIVDFGEIDVGNASKQMAVTLRNSGHKLAYFSVDLGRNNLELIVDPMKGTIEPEKDVVITVEVLGSEVGSFYKQFWIKTEPPRRVSICGIFIPATLVIEYPLTSFHVKLIDFPKTYFGAESLKTLVLQNSSSTESMFCAVAECGKNVEYLSKIREENDDLKCFSIKPKEGRLTAQQKYILQYSFAPKKMENFDQNYCLAFIKIMKVNYRDGIIVEKDVEVKTFPPANDREQYSISSLQSAQEFNADDAPEANFIRICLYGEMEHASVKLLPESFFLNYLIRNETYTYELRVQNNSNNLPILIKYNKEPCIEIEPRQVLLGPGCSVEVSLIIKPSKIGRAWHKIVFDLIYHAADKTYKVGTAYLPVQYLTSMKTPKIEPKFNMGITPKITDEVGFLVDDVRFNTNIEKPRQAIVDKNFKSFNNNNNALIAFPNDRPITLRPWKNTVPSHTIFANIPRILTEVDEYALTPAEFARKRFTRNVYATYINSTAKARQLKKPPINNIPDYDTTNEKHLLFEDAQSQKAITFQSRTRNYFSMHIPLPPERLMSVIVTPKYVQLGKIAPYTSCTNSFTIQNKNEFTIKVSIKALNNSVVIKEKERMEISPKQIKDILFDCYSHGVGKYYVPVFIIINGCHIFDATVFAKVVPTTVKCSCKEITIDPRINETFFEISNPVNCDISFSFEVQDNNFKVTPQSGIIPPRKSILCSIQFLPQNQAILKTEIYLISQSGAKQIIRVTLDNKKASVGFLANIVRFDNIPLNIPISKEIVLRNFSDIKIMYMISNPNPLEGITIQPKDGKINPKSDIHFRVTAHFKTVIDFNCFFKFVLQDVHIYVVNIAGNVVYPEIKMQPEYIQIHKIVSGAYIRRVFRVKNISEAQTFVSFPLESTPEFSITDLDKHNIEEVITLEPNESRELFLEFKPTEPIAYSIYIPYIINGIIGPAALNDPKTTVPMNYFRVTESKSVIALQLPEIISTTSIRCAGGAPWLKFSSLHIHLSFKNKRNTYFTITNISATEHQITIPLIEPDSPLSYELEKTINHKVNDRYYKVFIKPGEVATFKIEFHPSEYGQHEIELPINVEKYLEKCPFNSLKLFASYPMPSITCREKEIFFQSIFVRERVKQDITLDLVNHKEGCKVIPKVDNDSLSVRFLGTVVLTESHMKSNFRLTFDPKEECLVDCELVFTCTCCATSSGTVFVKASADDSYFISYQSILTIQATVASTKIVSTFPYFPKNSNDSFYARKMRIIQNDLEKWLFTQGFFFKNFYKIPYGLASIPADIQPTSTKPKKCNTKKPHLTLPLMQLLINLLDISVLKYFDAGKVPPSFENAEGTLFLFTTYRNIVSFLKSQLIFVPQLKPEHLLPYATYIAFKESFIEEDNKEVLFTEEEFHLYSKQCWVDLILRIYKMFVFKRTLNPAPFRGKSKAPPKPVIYQDEFMEYHAENFKEVINRSDEEIKLLLWLEFHFEKQKLLLWDSENIRERRKFRAFNTDLRDSLAFATIMVAYCPYMLNDFKNFYADFRNEEEMFHNACLLSGIWKKLNLSFEIRPHTIVEPLAMQMIFLVTYLYDILPNFYPTETITLEAPLGETAVSEMVLKNQGGVAISYTAIFFLNDSDVFQVDSKVITIPPKKEKKLKITYQAKTVLKKTATLVLSGENGGYKFSKSMAVTLVGIPKIFVFSDESVINIDTFQKVKKKLDISSPFEAAYEADIYLYLGDESNIPENISEFLPAATMTKRKIPREMTLESASTFDEDGDGVLNLTLCFVTVGVYTYFIFFLNQEVGDFCIKLTINSAIEENKTIDLEVVMPFYFNPAAPCICDNYTCRKGAMNLHCPHIVTIDVPCKNPQLTDGFILMLETCCEEDEFNFWAPLLKFPKGSKVLKMYLENTFDDSLVSFQNILSPTVTYVLDDSRNFSCPKKITLNHVFSEETYSLSVHLNGKKTPVEDILILTAEHGQEIRRYRLIFRKPNKTVMSKESVDTDYTISSLSNLSSKT